MNWGRIIQPDCENIPAPADPRCSDPGFSIANPDICSDSSGSGNGSNSGVLIIKPGVALCCLLGSIQFRAVLIKGGVETDVSEKTIFNTSDSTLAVIGVNSGNATGVAAGSVIISALYQNVADGTVLTASTHLTVFGEANCCEQVPVALMVMVCDSKGMSQSFGGAYASRLAFAKAAAKQFIGEVNGLKDTIGLMSFDDASFNVLSPPTGDTASVKTLVDSITQTQQITGFNLALKKAIELLEATNALERVIVVIGHGNDTSANETDRNDAISTAGAFKTGGGIVMCLGCRASGSGFLFLEALSTGGFFINSYPAVVSDSLTFFSGLKGYVCAGNCVNDGDTSRPTPQLHYCGFQKWEVSNGAVDLIGGGLNDFLPGNGLYVNLYGSYKTGDESIVAGGRPFQPGKMTTLNVLSLTKDNQYRLSLKLAGNQLIPGPPNAVNVRVFSRNLDGLPDPATAPLSHIVESGAALSETPTYKYVFTELNSNGETLQSPYVAVTPTTVNASVRIMPSLDTIIVSGAGTTDANGVYQLVNESITFLGDTADRYYQNGDFRIAYLPTRDADVPWTMWSFSDVYYSAATLLGVWTSIDNGENPLPTVTAQATSLAVYRTTGETPDSKYYLIGTVAPGETLVDHMNEFDMRAALVGGTVDSCENPPNQNSTGTVFLLLNQTISINDVTQGLNPYSFTFTAPADTQALISIQQLAWNAAPGMNNHGLILDSVLFTDATNVIDLFSDDFSNENVQFVPPACGQPTNTTVENNISATLTGLLWKIPCGPIDGLSCFCSDPADQTVQVQSSIDALFDVSVRIRGVVELFRYAGASVVSGTGGFCAVGGSSASGVQNVYDLIVSDPPAVYHLNYDSVNAVAPFGYTAVDYGFTFQARTGATITLRARTIDGIEHRNSSNFTVDGIGLSSSITQPFNGQFLQMDVTDSTSTVVSNLYGYDDGCYGTGCLNSNPPPTQIPDPNPLPDIEDTDTPPPSVFTSNKTACVGCPSGQINLSTENLVPVMTSNTAPSGIASADSNNSLDDPWKAFDHQPSQPNNSTSYWMSAQVLPNFLSYKFDAAKTIVSYAVTTSFLVAATNSIKAWKLQGSNNGTAWTDIDSQSNIYWVAGERKLFTASNTTAYLYYRIYITETNGGASAHIAELELFGQADTQVCGNASATSEISQQDADTKATAAATAAASAQLNCVSVFTASEQYTASCPVGSLGNPNSATRTAVATSLVSQSDAESKATAIARAAAESAIECNQSNNTQTITIPDIGAASVYPSVQNISDAGNVTKVTVKLSGFAHRSPQDVAILLVSPTGLTCELMSLCGGATEVGVNEFQPNRPFDAGIDIVFDDAAGSGLPHCISPTTCPLTAGTFKPTQNSSTVVYAAPAPARPYGTTLAVFNGIPKAGTWSLWVVDNAQFDDGRILGGWSLTIV